MVNKKQYIMAVLLLVLPAMLISGCTSPATKTVKTGDSVQVDYTGWLDDGTIFDTSDAAVAQQAGIYNQYIQYGPLNFTVGAGQYLEAFENASIGLGINQSRNITLTPAEAYGEYDPSLVQPVNMSMLTDAGIVPQVNDTLYYGTDPVKVVGIPNNTSVLIDFNHPMAGKTLHFTVTVRDIRTANATAAA